MESQFPLDEWAAELFLRKEIPSISHDEFIEMGYEKYLFWISVINTMKEKEVEKIEGKKTNYGSSE